jgi:glycerol-3-phosphate dehydrogenase subunit B
MFIATMPPSVPGIRSQMTLKSEFEKAGGRFFLGDTVVEAKKAEDGRIMNICTLNFGDIRLEADNFVLATGSFFSKGMIATPDKVYEPVFGIDLSYPEGRDQWFDRNFWDRQNYISYGAKTNTAMNAFRNGKPVSNLYVAGSILGGCNPLYEGCGGGLALLTALCAAESILEK